PYGLMAEFHDADALVEAARRTMDAGYRKIDAFTPFPVHGLAEAIRFKDNRVQLLVLAGGIAGAVTGFGLQYWVNLVAYPLNAGGKPLLSWPAFIPVTFEMTILFAAFAAVFGSMALNGLPQPYHPVFNTPRFALASRDRFFLVIESADPKFDPQATRAFLQGLHAHEVVDVAH
ncbi:MAG TPA: DUF3341 domain-containing protein, partial [Candidatus Limnocylindrales bacterium]|nr:DUF3341 domain-containing protein [Candidatus Limnocylindrales bacterium]